MCEENIACLFVGTGICLSPFIYHVSYHKVNFTRFGNGTTKVSLAISFY